MGIRMAGSVALAEGLTKRAALEWPDLQDNTLSQPGDQAFTSALPSWPDLRPLKFFGLRALRGGRDPAGHRGSRRRIESAPSDVQNDNLEDGTVSVLARAVFAEVSEGKDEEADDLAGLLDKVSLTTT